MGRRYDRKEVEEILRRAVGSEVGEDGLAHEDLVAAAAEVGVSPEAVERAAAELALERERDGLLARVTRKRRHKFWRRFVSYLGLSGVLFALDAVTPGGTWWYWAVIGLAFPMVRLGVRTYLPSDQELERAMDEEARREEQARARRERRRRRREERERKRGDSRRREAQFEQIMERAVDALLRAADRKLEKLDARPERGVPNVPDVQPQVRGRVRVETPSGSSPATDRGEAGSSARGRRGSE